MRLIGFLVVILFLVGIFCLFTGWISISKQSTSDVVEISLVINKSKARDDIKRVSQVVQNLFQ